MAKLCGQSLMGAGGTWHTSSVSTVLWLQGTEMRGKGLTTLALWSSPCSAMLFLLPLFPLSIPGNTSIGSSHHFQLWGRKWKDLPVVCCVGCQQQNWERNLHLGAYLHSQPLKGRLSPFILPFSPREVDPALIVQFCSYQWAQNNKQGKESRIFWGPDQDWAYLLGRAGWAHVLLGMSLNLLDLQHWLNHLGTTVIHVTTRQHTEKHTLAQSLY